MSPKRRLRPKNGTAGQLEVGSRSAPSSGLTLRCCRRSGLSAKGMTRMNDALKKWFSPVDVLAPAAHRIFSSIRKSEEF